MVLTAVQLQHLLTSCYNLFVTVTASSNEVEFVERRARLSRELARLHDGISAWAPAQARQQLLNEDEMVLRHRQELLEKLERSSEVALKAAKDAEAF